MSSGTVTGTAGDNGRAPGLVMLGELAEAVGGDAFAARIETRLRRKPLHSPGGDAPIRRLAWCTGAAQSCIVIWGAPEASRTQNARFTAGTTSSSQRIARSAATAGGSASATGLRGG